MDPTSNSFKYHCEIYSLNDDCPIFPGMFSYIQQVAGASITAAQHLISGDKDIVINWDGGRHHSKRDEAAGFCYVNDIVLSIVKLHEKFDRVMYIDVDIHHGGLAYLSRRSRGGIRTFEKRVYTLISYERSGVLPWNGRYGGALRKAQQSQTQCAPEGGIIRTNLPQFIHYGYRQSACFLQTAGDRDAVWRRRSCR
jgi:Histone deacetylase domain